MSRFAVLREDEPDDPDDETSACEPLSRLTPQYSISDVLKFYKSGAQLPPPAELPHYDHVFLKDAQSPECSTFRPPQSEINSPFFLSGGKQPSRSFQNSGTRRSISPRNQAQPRPKRPAPSRPADTHDFDEEVGLMWFYKDPMDQVMGPYSSRRMREWFDKKYFDATLPIVVGGGSTFQPIANVFPDLSLAFGEEAGQPGKGGFLDGIDDRAKEKKLETLMSFFMAEGDDGGSWETVDLTH
jgi:hypothetical protein